MRRLYLLRHAKSSWDNPTTSDFDRPLNARGKKAAVLLNQHLLDEKIRPELVLCSPARRTRETCEALAQALRDSAIRHDRGIYQAGPENLLAILRHVPADVKSVMVIGHNPGLEQLAGQLIAPGEAGDYATRMQEKFPTGGLATLGLPGGWAELAEGSCTLKDFLRPADIE